MSSTKENKENQAMPPSQRRRGNSELHFPGSTPLDSERLIAMLTNLDESMRHDEESNNTSSSSSITSSVLPQAPSADEDPAADKHNLEILNIRGLHPVDLAKTTSLQIYNLADKAARNRELNVAQAIKGVDAAWTFEPFWFFFYGSLQLPRVLARVCWLDRKGDEELVMRKGASIGGWKIMLWGPFPALVPSADEARVQGMAWKCERPEHLAALASYETDAYRLEYCKVTIESSDENGAKKVEVIDNARTFVSTEEADDLDEGEWLLEEYVKTHMVGTSI
ncbi:Uu.00g057160.m01.CDS01 [Anthostomella pinea]|uniref:Putative gamma-glutamylcyclotransferase n=1 Tax=Anthostomella pinea TaxID=933095 RepID=A0AAI8VRP2_9PEZI|nr:Uu.00g057160.m01.CDS01 [Anthostomella pinea]